MIKLFEKLMCDNCGKINPPVTVSGKKRITLCCLDENGMYTVPESKTKRGLGKTTSITTYLRWPFRSPIVKDY